MNLNTTFKSSCTLFTNTYKASLIVYQTALQSHTQLVLCCYHAVERNTTTNLLISQCQSCCALAENSGTVCILVVVTLSIDCDVEYDIIVHTVV